MVNESTTNLDTLKSLTEQAKALRSELEQGCDPRSALEQAQELEEALKDAYKRSRKAGGNDMEPIFWVLIGLAVAVITAIVVLYLKKGNGNSSSKVNRSATSKTEITQNDVDALKIIRELAKIYKKV